MHNTLGRHRKPSAARTIAKRTAVSAGAAAAAVLMSAGGATAATASAPAAVPPFPCTGYPIDSFTTCGASGGYGNGSSGGDRGDAVGADTPSLGGGGGK